LGAGSTAREVTSISKRYYALTTDGREASVYIFGDIVSLPWLESDVSSYALASQIERLDVDTIHVYINSYGGEVAEGLAIYNQLRRHKARVKTYCEGFACSAASVVFMAGDERIMSHSSLLMIHNAWMWTVGDPNELRKDADDLEIINQATINAYMSHVRISEARLKAMMDVETWISAQDALDMGFATAVENPASGGRAVASYRLRLKIADKLLQQQPGKLKVDIGGVVDALEARLRSWEPEPERKAGKLRKLIAAIAAAKEAKS